MTEITCPYCGHVQNEPDECYSEGELYEAQCKECNKIYGIRPFYTKGYHESKMDCANGSEHKWEKIHGMPPELYKYKRRCAYCGEEKIIDEAKHVKSCNEYSNKLDKISIKN